MERLLLFALHLEALPTLEALQAQLYSKDHYRFSGGHLVISGVGSYAAQLAVTRLAPQVEEIWNLGFAGAIDDQLQIGTVEEIGIVKKHLPLPRLDATSLQITEAHLPQIDLGGEVCLATSDFPIHDSNLQPQGAHLVDMEGYGIAYAANALGKRCRMWKIVSDFASKGGREMIRREAKALAEKLAQRVMDESSVSA